MENWDLNRLGQRQGLQAREGDGLAAGDVDLARTERPF